MDNVVLKDRPNRENAIKFINFFLEPENAAEVAIFASHMSGVEGAMALASNAIKQAPELNPPVGQTGQFVQSCTQDVQVLYDRIWTELKK